MTDDIQVPSPYGDYDLVYVDPETNSVVAKLEWNKNDTPKSMEYVAKESEAKDGRRRWRKFYPWGTYRSMKNAFKVDGKPRRKEPTKTLEEVLPMALKEPYWD